MRRAVEVFIRRGYDATSVGDLAAELGLSKSAIYHHVPSKEHLLSLALDDALEGLEAVIADATREPRDVSAYARLRGAVRQSVLVLVDKLPSVTLLLRVRGNGEVEISALARRRRIDEQLAGLVRDAVSEGTLRNDIAPDLISRLLFGTVNSLTEWYRPDGEVDAATLADAVVELAFDGLTVPRG